MNEENIPLLAGKPLSSFTPEEFKEHVKKLKTERRVRQVRISPPYKWTLTRTGKISIKCTRVPKWITREELVSIHQESGSEENLIQIYCEKKKITIVATQEEGEALTKKAEEILLMETSSGVTPSAEKSLSSSGRKNSSRKRKN